MEGAAKTTGLIGDVHQEDGLLDRALDYLEANRVDAILCVGDIADGRGDLGRCRTLLVSHAVRTVRGNHDGWLLDGSMRDLPEAMRPSRLTREDRKYLESLPPTSLLQTVAGPLLLCHGAGDDDMKGVLPYDSEASLLQHRPLATALQEPGLVAVVAGHTHVPMLRKLGNCWWINPGTLHREQSPGFSVVDWEKRLLRRYCLVPDVRQVEQVSLP
jgi:predicted phosphodiesterase